MFCSTVQLRFHVGPQRKTGSIRAALGVLVSRARPAWRAQRRDHAEPRWPVFLYSLNVESLRGVRPMHPAAMRQILFEDIDVDYSRVRRYSALGHTRVYASEIRMVA